MNRRTLLASLTAAGAAGIPGCSTPPSTTGYVQSKAIDVWRNEESQAIREDVIRVSLGVLETTQRPRVEYLADEWADRFSTPRRPTVSEALHRELQTEYNRVSYTLSVCSEEWGDDSNPAEGCRFAATSRADFSQVQVYDRVTATLDHNRMTIENVKGTETFTPEKR